MQVTNTISFGFSLLGTSMVIRRLGLKMTLLAFPCMCLAVVIMVMMFPKLYVSVVLTNSCQHRTCTRSFKYGRDPLLGAGHFEKMLQLRPTRGNPSSAALLHRKPGNPNLRIVFSFCCEPPVLLRAVYFARSQDVLKRERDLADDRR